MNEHEAKRLCQESQRHANRLRQTPKQRPKRTILDAIGVIAAVFIIMVFLYFLRAIT